MFTDVVILAGGFGERLWPASRPGYPKHFLSLEGGISFLQSSVLRAAAIEPSGKILIITRTDLLEIAADQCRALIEQTDDPIKTKLKNDLYIIPEPCPRHTAAPALLACFFLETIQPEIKHLLLILTSDHVITPTEAFIHDCAAACEYAQKNFFVCFAIPPSEPATGFGYIKAGSQLNQNGVFSIASFKEKPDTETACEYLSQGNYWWNSGMFGFTADFFKRELEQCTPEIYHAFESFQMPDSPVTGYFNGIKYLEHWKAMESAYAATPAISLDTAVAEKTKSACAVKATFSWDDVGSWDAFEKLFSENPGQTALVNSKNCFIYSDIPVAICGVDDLVVVIKNGNALVMKKGSSTLVREAVHKLKKQD